MTKWTLPEGRTAVDYKELYKAAKRDAEEAEAYAAELEAKLVKVSVFLQFLDENYRHAFGDTARQKIRELYAELKGEKDE